MYRQDPEGFRRLVRSLLEKGADRYCIWDGDAQYDGARIGDIGHREWRGPKYEPDAAPAATVALRALNGFHIDRYGSCEIV